MESPSHVLLCVLPELPARLLAAALEEAGFVVRPVRGASEAGEQLEAAPGKAALVVEAGTLRASAAWRALLDGHPEAALVLVSTASPSPPEQELVSERRGALVRDPLDLWSVEQAVRRVLGLPAGARRTRRARGSASPSRRAGGA